MLSYSLVGLCGCRDGGLEPEELVRPEDALSIRSSTLRARPVPDVCRGDDPAALTCHPSRAAYDAADHRVAALLDRLLSVWATIERTGPGRAATEKGARPLFANSVQQRGPSGDRKGGAPRQPLCTHRGSTSS